MKKLLAVIMIAALLLCAGCSKLIVESIDSSAQTQTEPTQAPVSSTPVPTEAPAVEASPEPEENAAPELVEPEPVSEPEPDTVPGKLVYERTAAVLQELKRGDKVEILDEQGEYCSVKVGDVTGLIKKSLLRADNSAAYQSWGGYTGFSAVLYKNFKLTGSSIAMYPNNPVTVLDEYDDCYVVSYNGDTYYADKDSVNAFTVHYWTPEADGGSYSDSGDNSGGADGGDIQLTACEGSDYALTLLGTNTRSSHIPALLDDTGTVVASAEGAAVKVDGAELILCFIEPGTELRVIERGESNCTVYYEKTVVSLPSCLVKLDTDADYKAWTGYAARFAPSHSSYLLNDKTPLALVTNSQLTILDDLGCCYVISVNGNYRFLAHEQVNKSPVNYMAGYTAPEENAEAPEEELWTEPML